MSSERMIKIPFMAKPLIFLIQQYTICFKKAIKRGKTPMTKQLGMNRQERWFDRKNLRMRHWNIEQLKLLLSSLQKLQRS